MRSSFPKNRLVTLVIFAASLVFVSYITITISNKAINSNATKISKQAPSKSIDQWAELLNQCPKSDFLIKKNTKEVENCISGVWLKAWGTKMLNNFNLSLKIFIEENPNLNNICHQSGHAAGYNSYTENLLTPELLQSVVIGDDTCNNGFLHGLFDGFANKAKTPDEFKLLVGTCTKLRGLQLSTCTDGTGHAAFQYTHDPYKALDMCREHGDLESQHGCGLGVFMQMYRDDADNNFEPYMDYASVKSEWPVVCNKLEEKDNYISFRKGCLESFGYLLAQDIGFQILFWSADHETGKTTPEEDIKIGKTVGEYFQSCSFLANEFGIKTCKDTFAQNLVWQTSSNYKSLKFLCEQLDSEFYNVCYNSKIPAFENTSQARQNS
jgi:hypothetical protein